jgi:hypothetical protein
MTSGPLTWGADLDKDPGGSDMTPFPMENAVTTVCGGWPPLGRHRMSNLSPRTQLVVVGGMGLRGVTAQVSQYPYK